MRLRAVSALTLLFAVGCGAPTSAERDPTATERQPITHGSDDPGDPAVVALVDATDAAVCTGTLIDPHTVLTAAHCEIGPRDLADYRVFFGADTSGSGTFVGLSDALIHPAYDPVTHAHDLALLTLAKAVTTAPVPLDPRTVDASFVGQTFRAVGFGMTTADAGDQGKKRVGTATVSAVESLDFTIQSQKSQPCVADSGGPALFTDNGTTYVSGVVSHGDAACTDHAAYARIDVDRSSFIQPYLDKTAPGTAKPGDRCLYPGQCESSTCVAATDEPEVTYCAPACPDGSGCPSGMVCKDVKGAGKQCRYPTPTPGAMGAPCSSDSDCWFSQCTDKGFCSRHCTPEANQNDCPAGFECANTSGIDFYCVPVPKKKAASTSCSLRPGPSSSRDGLPLLAVCFALGLALASRRRSRSHSDA